MSSSSAGLRHHRTEDRTISVGVPSADVLRARQRQQRILDQVIIDQQQMEDTQPEASTMPTDVAPTRDSPPLRTPKSTNNTGNDDLRGATTAMKGRRSESMRAEGSTTAVQQHLPTARHYFHFAATRDKFMHILQCELLDWRKNSPLKVHQCLDDLTMMYKNALATNPNPKHFEVRADNRRLRQHVLSIPGGENLLLCSQWLPTVKDHEKHFVFSPTPGNIQILSACVGIISTALPAVVRRERMAAEKAKGKHEEAEAYKAEIRLQIEADRMRRRMKTTWQSEKGRSDAGTSSTF